MTEYHHRLKISPSMTGWRWTVQRQDPGGDGWFDVDNGAEATRQRAEQIGRAILGSRIFVDHSADEYIYPEATDAH